MRLKSEEIMKQLLDTEYIDANLKDLSYDHLSHTVIMKYGEFSNDEPDCTVIFKDCFSVNLNTWLEGMKGTVPKKPGELDFFFHDIEIEDIEINGIKLYKCSMVIPMMDCQIICVNIEILNH
ncbi:hypothetical protein [Bacillus sp. AFS017336]|uniref:hypothetical protein n=1 Tax=Bacillus sp. AFS017336 TaxID=2033489 RepID=UPI000BEF20A3|nr:hypothetical protein [Bacillus sp. AFS017336]PEK98901.1 hypothetical protein CN601_24735 [Bacillus sp. AFS017336]